MSCGCRHLLVYLIITNYCINCYILVLHFFTSIQVKYGSISSNWIYHWPTSFDTGIFETAVIYILLVFTLEQRGLLSERAFVRGAFVARLTVKKLVFLRLSQQDKELRFCGQTKYIYELYQATLTHLLM